MWTAKHQTKFLLVRPCCGFLSQNLWENYYMRDLSIDLHGFSSIEGVTRIFIEVLLLEKRPFSQFCSNLTFFGVIFWQKNISVLGRDCFLCYYYKREGVWSPSPWIHINSRKLILQESFVSPLRSKLLSVANSIRTRLIVLARAKLDIELQYVTFFSSNTHLVFGQKYSFSF